MASDFFDTELKFSYKMSTVLFEYSVEDIILILLLKVVGVTLR